MDAVLPPNTLAVFPVQPFSHDELLAVARRGSTGRAEHDTVQIFFGNSFEYPRPQPDGSVQIHRAVDIMGPTGVPIFSTMDGVVATTWRVQGDERPGVGTVSNPPNNDGGNYVVVIDNVAGRYHYYAHMAETPLVLPGQRVVAGQRLGVLGNTGRGGPPHLHYQVTTRNERGAARIFWNPYFELVRLVQPLGAYMTGQRARLEFDDFLRTVRTRDGVGSVEPWSGEVTPEIRYPWDDGFF